MYLTLELYTSPYLLQRGEDDDDDGQRKKQAGGEGESRLHGMAWHDLLLLPILPISSPYPRPKLTGRNILNTVATVRTDGRILTRTPPASIFFALGIGSKEIPSRWCERRPCLLFHASRPERVLE
jgi:hypothetical protein